MTGKLIAMAEKPVKQKCIACKQKFESDEQTLICPDCFKKYLANLQKERKAGVCPICRGNVQFTEFYAKIYYAGEKLCSDKCARIARLIKYKVRRNER